MPDGSAFEFTQKANAVPTTVGGVTKDAKSSGEVAPTINTASENSISTSNGNVNAKFSMKGMDSAYLAAVERGDTEATQNAKTTAGEGSGVKYSLKNTSRGVAVVVDNDILNDIDTTTSWALDGKLKHPRTDNFVDFAHGDVLIQSGNNQYDADVIVGLTDTGESVFYDVVDIVPTQFQLKKESPTAVSDKNAVNAIQGDSSNSSIPTYDENVNAKFSLKGMDRDYSYSALVRKPDMRLTQIAETSPGNRADIIRETKPVRGSPVSRTGGHNRCVSQKEFSTVSEGSQAVERKQQYCLRKVHTYDLQKLVLFTIIVHSNREMTTLR